MKPLLMITLVALFAPSASAQTVMEIIPERLEQSINTESEHPVLFDALKLRTTELLEAAISVEEKGAKITYAPLIYRPSYREFFSETRLQLSQKEGLTTLGIGALYNPTSPRSGRGDRLWVATTDTTSEAGAILLLRSRLAPLNKEVGQILDRIRQNSASAADQTRLTELNSQVQALNREVVRLEESEDKRIKARILRFDEALVVTSVPVVGVSER